MVLRDHNQQLLRRRDDSAHRMDGQLLHDAVNRGRQSLKVRLLSRFRDILNQ